MATPKLLDDGASVHYLSIGRAAKSGYSGSCLLWHIIGMLHIRLAP